MMDLRLLGVTFKKIPVSEFTGRMLPWTRLGFTMLVVTGLLIFYSAPVRYYHNVFFRIKVVLLIVGGLNMWWFHSGLGNPQFPGNSRLCLAFARCPNGP